VHWQNLNASLGAAGGLAEVESLAQSQATAATMLAGMGANGFAAVVNAPATAGSWGEVLGGEGGPVAIDPTSHLNSWYANNGAGVSIFHCASATVGAGCTAAGFGTTPVVGEAQVGNDGLGMESAAEFVLDGVDPSQVLIGTCRVWRGPVTGIGWTGTNAISPILDGTGGSVCNGNAVIRSIASLATTGGGEVIYAGMAGQEDGGGTVAGHVFAATIPPGGNWLNAVWTDLTFSPVNGSGLAFNAFGRDVSALYVDPHDLTGGTVYVTIAAFASHFEQAIQLYRTTDRGQRWAAIASNLPNSPANAVAVDAQDPNTVYVGMDAGVYVTRAVASCVNGATAGGACWAPYGSGLPLAPVTSLLATPSSATTQVLTAATYGRGVWQTPTATAGVTLTTATATPVSLTFANQTVGTAAVAQTVTLKTTGTAPLTVTSVAFTGNGSADFSETDTCTGVAVAKNAGCAVKVVFAPTAAGSRAATMLINGNVATGEIAVPLSGTGLTAGNITLLPTSLSFGTQQVGTTSATQTVNLQNAGGSSVALTSVTVSAPFKKVSSTCGSSLAAGGSCVTTVSFAPTVAGSATGSVAAVDGAGTQTATLNGTGVSAATDTLSTTSLTFPLTAIGQISTPQVVQITNSGGLPLTGIGVSVAGDFAAVSNCGSQLGPGGSCSVSVTFSPTLAATESGTLTISDAIRAQTVRLSGNGQTPGAFSVTPNSLTFASQLLNVPSVARSVSVANTGGIGLSQVSFSFTGPGAAGFQIGTTTCGPVLVRGAPCSVQVIFDPAVSGAVTATLVVAASNIGVAPAMVSLSGTGLIPPILQVAPTSLSLGPVAIGNSSAEFTVSVTNTGQTAMTGLAFSLNGFSGPAGSTIDDYEVDPPTDITACGTTLNPAATCNMQVMFSPSEVGTETATFVVTSGNAVPPTATVSLTGSGTPEISLQASPPVLEFPATPVGTISAALQATLSNLSRQTVNGLTLSVSGPYALVPALTTCGTKIVAITSCAVGLSFTPVASGDQLGALTATVNNLGVPPLVVSLDGSGIGVGGIQPSPTQMTFGSIVTGNTSSAQTLRVTNSGQAALAGLQINVIGDYSLTANQCGATLQPQASCAAGVVMTPTTTGARAGSVTISSTSTGVAPAQVGLTGNGVPSGSITANPAVASFGTVTVGQTSPTQQVTLTNSGATVLTGLTFQLAGDFSMPQNTCGTQMASGAVCSLGVSFSPGQPGTRIGSVTIRSTTAGFVPVVLGLSGTGLPTAQLAVTPNQLTFGSVNAGSNSLAQQLTVTNPGTGVLEGLSFVTARPFSVGSGSCGTSLAAGSTCGVPVTFSPTIGGSQTGMVTVVSTSVGVPSVLVPVSGTGVAPPSLSLSPGSLVFAGTTVGKTSAGQTVTISNPGGAGIAGLTVVAGGDFLVSSTSCGTTLAGGANCTAQVSFTPSVAGGRQGFLSAASTTIGVASANATLSGAGLTPASLSMAPGQLTFQPTPVGQTTATQTVTVKNSGQSSIIDLQLVVTPGFRMDASQTTCTATLAAGAACSAGVIFAPTSGGTSTGAITANSLAAGIPSATAALSGVGALPPGIVSSPRALVQFGTTGVGQTGQSVTLTVTNQGTTAALTGVSLAIDATGVSNGFGLSGNNCGTAAAPGSLAAATSCTVSVTFAPTIAGQLTGTLLISSTNGNGTVKLALIGSGFDFRFIPLGTESVTVVRGQTAYYTFGVTPLAGSSGSDYSFACAQLPANTSCTFNPAHLSGLGVNVTGNVTIAVTTMAATSAAVDSNHGRGSILRGRMLLVCCVLVMPLALRRRGGSLRISARLVLLAAIMAAVVSGVSSCASAGVSSPQLHIGGGTPPGSYSVPVTASSTGVAHSVSVKLIVN